MSAYDAGVAVGGFLTIIGAYVLLGYGIYWLIKKLFS